MLKNINNRIKGLIKHKKSVFFIVIAITISLFITIMMAQFILVNTSKQVEVFSDKEATSTAKASTETNDSKTAGTQISSAETNNSSEKLPKTKSADKEPIKTKNIKLTLKNGKVINSNDLIRNLDKTTDETIKYVYNQLPNNIKIECIYEGGFSNPTYSELLVIFKFSPGTHVAGLDFSVAAIYNRNTLDLVSQQSFTSDECHFDLVKDVNKVAYLIYSGTTTYQGHSTCTLQLLNLSKNWEQLLPQEKSIYGEDLYKFELVSNGLISVLEPEFLDNDVVEWKKKYYLKWNEKTSQLEDFIPETLSDTKNHKFFDIASTSPNGKFAIVSHEWGFDDDSYILIYDIAQNKLVSKYNILAQELGYSWSPDSKKVCVTRFARIWIDTCIVDMNENSIVSIMDDDLAGYLKFQEQGIKFAYKIRDFRPDPYIQLCEWSPDSKELLMLYQWTDSEDNRQSGNFVLSLDKKAVSKITQNKPNPEGGNIEPTKPKGFKW